MKYSLLMLVTLAFASVAHAQASRCDCSKIVGTCHARASTQGNKLTLMSSSPACSRIDFHVNGQPFVSTITGGEEEQWMDFAKITSLNIVSCDVCHDENSSREESSSESPGASSGSMTQPGPEACYTGGKVVTFNQACKQAMLSCFHNAAGTSRIPGICRSSCDALLVKLREAEDKVRQRGGYARVVDRDYPCSSGSGAKDVTDLVNFEYSTGH